MKRYRARVVFDAGTDVFHIRATSFTEAMRHVLARLYSYKDTTSVELSEVADIL